MLFVVEHMLILPVVLPTELLAHVADIVSAISPCSSARARNSRAAPRTLQKAV
jgi:hypothetical protein